jgi:hypothetical protein
VCYSIGIDVVVVLAQLMVLALLGLMVLVLVWKFVKSILLKVELFVGQSYKEVPP